jgi:hypothetical protein
MRKILGKIVVLSTILLLLSCDKDFNTIGSEIIGDGHYEFDKYTVQNLKAYSKETGAVQSNNLPVNSLGVYNDPFFGTNISEFVSQVELERVAPTFGVDVQITNNDSVYLYVPYFSTRTATGTGNLPNSYKLESVHGNTETSINLKIYENKYFLRDFDGVNPSERQKYFSDDKSLIETVSLSGSPLQLNDSANPAENSEFKFSNSEYIIFKTNGEGAYVNNSGAIVTDVNDRIIKERFVPGMWINLNKEFFRTKVLQANASNLLNQNNFKEFFKGLYFKVEANSGEAGALAQLDFSKAVIHIQYRSRENASADLKKKTFKLNLKGNTVNFFTYTKTSDYQNVLNDSDFNLGDPYLYLKGGDGSVAFIDLFGSQDVNDENLSGQPNGVPDELDELRANKWLINDAVITFFISNSGQKALKRIYLYDVNNGIPLLDYTEDLTSNADTKLNKSIYGGILQVDSQGDGILYKFKIRGHINKILNSTNTADLKNVRLGLVVTENINITNLASVKTPFSFPVLLPTGTPDQVVSKVPVSSVMNPLGTILFGSNTTDEKKMKLEIYYTKPN